MGPTLHVVDFPVAGRLATMARPRGGEDLAEEVAGLRGAGVDIVVSALTSSEYEQLALTAEPDAIRAAGMEFVAHPIVDLGVPSGDGTRELADRLAQAVTGGRFVVVHCWAGIGRSSLIAGAVLVRLGSTPAEAWRLISAARGFRVPETPEQGEWLITFAATRDDTRASDNE
jgi:protein-tyrosine phosphatase